ncbi:HAUS augmin-like complex subunit 6 N-terminus-domain-containing protein [Stachybotrys elegans]|uniref:HAUS augmin-like complex subunit 6 N-terminus-domain-containing protein n=1 Tax=Stachybotrys elegans TaxID=80388 RepID=A0A8K0T327_9HYPO|nr:HAUS augmin-like complex subunit 6 N-terminus-domain-containing protein [Stachybotrys elegans]
MSSSSRLQQSRPRLGRPQVANTTKPLQAQQPSGVFNPSPSNPGTVSSLSVFLTSLKLLDLDLLPDWPGISAQTFATTGPAAATQGHKKRVQCVEWALFQLFSLWDPEETKTRLKPFFPPLDQVQSINLRAALLRALEQAKKNGVLGRDAVLRKTMLDECKGERLEEVLASFSIAVLKKVVADDLAASGLHHALAVSLALENRGYREDKTELEVLNIAHRVKLRKLLERRGAARTRYRDFSDMLSVKERAFARRGEEIRARQHGMSNLSSDAKSEMRRMVRNNWTGDEHWMETLLYGTAAVDKERLMAMPFDRVWRRVQQGRLADLEEDSGGLLEQLDARVAMQNKRLEKWRSMRRNMSGGQPDMSSPSKPKNPKRSTKGIDLGFGAHESLHMGRVSPRKPTGPVQLNSEYINLVQDLKNGLDKMNKRASDPMAFLRCNAAHQTPDVDAYAGPDMVNDGAISDLSDFEDEEAGPSLNDGPSQKSTKPQVSRRLPARPKLSYPDGPSLRTSSSIASLRRRSTMPDEDFDIEMPDIQTRISPTRQDVEMKAAVPRVAPEVKRRRVTPPKIEKEEEWDSDPYDNELASPTQNQADYILESMNQASPSPLRPRPRPALSLAERTRLSMARGSAIFLQDEEPELPPVVTPDPPAPIPEEGGVKLTVGEPEDLISRTRRSMAGFEKAKQKAQLERRRSQRRSKLPPRREGSYFPKVDEDTQEQTLLLTEELIGEEDMEAVFRSRPKIKASPLQSPTREWD